jgi:hypothetical protein
MFRKLHAICFVSLILALVVAFSLKPQGVNDTRLMLDANWLATPPITITELFRHSEKISPLTPFHGYDGWLRDLRIRVRNTSKTPIRYIEVSIQFPGSRQDNGNWLLADHKMMKGRNYAASRNIVSDVEELLLKPDETTDLSFSEYNYQAFARRAANVPAYVLKTVKVKITTIVFDDLDSGWMRGIYVKRDKSQPENSEQGARWVPDRERISSNLSKPAQTLSASLGKANSLVPKKGATACYGPFDVIHPQCKGFCDFSDCIHDNPREQILSTEWNLTSGCNQCYRASTGLDCATSCQQSYNDVDYQSSCP